MQRRPKVVADVELGQAGAVRAKQRMIAAIPTSE